MFVGRSYDGFNLAGWLAGAAAVVVAYLVGGAAVGRRVGRAKPRSGRRRRGRAAE